MDENKKNTELKCVTQIYNNRWDNTEKIIFNYLVEQKTREEREKTNYSRNIFISIKNYSLLSTTYYYSMFQYNFLSKF